MPSAKPHLQNKVSISNQINGTVIPVMKAMQGHLESSQLWEKHCDKFIRSLGFTPRAHEPCLYVGEIEGKRCIFKRQVDDFALACRSAITAHKFYNMVDDHLSNPIKRMGLVTLFNGIDILQSRYYVKISCETYIKKFCMKYLLRYNNFCEAHSNVNIKSVSRWFPNSRRQPR